ncbi:GNAT family N-acetyltransferase [Maricaulis maris]|uniref:CelD/BcsL family acetyltransferase involved in cellulose biosynthesis n=1 Tax=Maricaulis maris TaxID=74318 RepID=A0A495DLX9_9PROT|nr:GNAT family N-acetyltransferase [Maricaulis maris]RKR03927.1 CelD/BcsL family acetyltransferase involved in cellulose biosynthesis [Maricaulis maris]
MIHAYRLRPASELRPRDWQGIQAIRLDNPAYASPFFDPDYLRAVAAVQPGLAIGFAEHGGEMRAAWPVQRRANGWCRAPAAPFTDWDGPILAPDVSIEPSHMLRELGLAGYSGNNLVTPVTLDHAHLNTTRNALSDLGTDGAAFLRQQASRHPRQFKKMRRLERRLHDAHSVRFTLHSTSPADLAALIALKWRQLRATGRHDVLSRAWVHRLLKQLHAGSPDGRFGPLFSTLHLDGRLAAAEFNLRSADRVHGWLTAFDPEFGQYSPGHVLMQHMFAAMPGIGVRQYDAGSLEHGYKRFYANDVVIGHSATIDAVTDRPRSRPLAQIIRHLEYSGPAMVRSMVARSRRRFDQICATERSPIDRARSVGASLCRLANLRQGLL